MSLVKKINLASEVTGSLPSTQVSGAVPLADGTLLTGANQAARLASAAVKKDSYLQQDTGVRWLLITDPATVAGNWQQWNPGGPAASEVVNIPAGDIAAVTVQAAINELDTEKVKFSQVQNQSLVAAADTGAADAYAIALSPAIAAYVSQQRFSFKAANTNTGASTLAVNGLAAKAIKKNVTDDLIAGDIVANQQIEVVYDGTNFQLVSRPPTVDIPYVKVSDTKASATDGGTFTTGAWRTRDINTEDSDTAGICSIAANQITLSAGTYICKIFAPAYGVDQHKARLQNTTGATTLVLGKRANAGAPGASAGMSESIIAGKFTVAAAQALEVQHYCRTTRATDGFGTGFADAGVSEVYTVAEFWKVG